MLTRRGFLKGLGALGGLLGIGAKVVDVDPSDVKVETIDVDAIYRAAYESRHWEREGDVVPEEGVYYHALCSYCHNRYVKSNGYGEETGCFDANGVLLWQDISTRSDPFHDYHSYSQEFICDRYNGPASKAYLTGER